MAAAAADRGMKSEEVNGIVVAFARDRFQDSQSIRESPLLSP